MRTTWTLAVLGGLLWWAGLSAVSAAPAEDLVIYDFEGSTQDWTIPDWAQTSPDYAGKSLSPSDVFASHGKGALQLLVNFPGGGKWTGAYVEQMMYVNDWSPFATIAVDVYVPAEAPKGIAGRFILGIGEQWTWTEMNRAKPLEPGKWVTITANLKPGSLDWKFFPDDAFRKDVRKVGIRIESEKAAYSGQVFIDNVRLIN